MSKEYSKIILMCGRWHCFDNFVKKGTALLKVGKKKETLGM